MSAAPWCSGQACWPLEPATAVRIRSGLNFGYGEGHPLAGLTTAHPGTSFKGSVAWTLGFRFGTGHREKESMAA
jgi:hypothetical protein